VNVHHDDEARKTKNGEMSPLPGAPNVEVVLRHFHRCGSFVGGAQIAEELAIREYGGHQDLRGSGRRSVIPYVHG
jgi:hypothetical protein